MKVRPDFIKKKEPDELSIKSDIESEMKAQQTINFQPSIMALNDLNESPENNQYQDYDEF